MYFLASQVNWDTHCQAAQPVFWMASLNGYQAMQIIDGDITGCN